MKDVEEDHEDDNEDDDGGLRRGPGGHADYSDLSYNSLRILLQILPACRVVHEALFSGTNNPPPLFSAGNNSGKLIRRRGLEPHGLSSTIPIAEVTMTTPTTIAKTTNDDEGRGRGQRRRRRRRRRRPTERSWRPRRLQRFVIQFP